jgi:hypothetical protein
MRPWLPGKGVSKAATWRRPGGLYGWGTSDSARDRERQECPLVYAGLVSGSPVWGSCVPFGMVTMC